MIHSLLFLAAQVTQQDDARRQMEESIAKQKAAIQKQVGGDGFFTSGFFTPTLPDCPALTEQEVDPFIQAAATKHGVEPAVLKAMIRQESGFRPCAVSPKGAMGLMQLTPETADLMHLADVLDAAQNIDAGAAYLKKMLERFKNDLPLALAAYNAGPEKVSGKVPDIPETKDYVAGILKSLESGKKPKPQ